MATDPYIPAMPIIQGRGGNQRGNQSASGKPQGQKRDGSTRRNSNHSGRNRD